MKKLLSVLMAIAILCMSFAVVSFAEETNTASVVATESVFTRTGKYGGSYMGNSLLAVVTSMTSYLKFDVSSLKAAMNGKDAKYTLILTSKNDSAAGTVNVYGISGENRMETLEVETFCYDATSANGMHDDVSNMLGTASVTAKNQTLEVDVTAYINTLSENDVAMLKLQNMSLSSTVTFWARLADNTAYRPTLTATRTYLEGTEAVFDGITVPEVASESIILPTVGSIYGSELLWESSNTDVIANDGTVTRGEKTEKATLTATYVGYENIKKNFDVIVPEADAQLTSSIATVEDIFTRSGRGVQGTGLLVVNNGWTTYLKFNVSDLRTAMNGKDAKYTLQFTSRFDAKAGDVNVYGISGDNRTGWSETSLDYSTSLANGMEADLSNYLGTVNVPGADTTVTIDVTEYIREIPEDGIATLKLHNNALTVNVTLCDSTHEAKPILIAERTFREITEDLLEGIELSKVATENLELPKASKLDATALINWVSSNPSVIAADGTVTRQEGEALVTLTATCGTSSKSFDVIVPAAGAETTAVIDVLEDTYTRSGANQYAVQGSDMLVVDSGRTTYLKFNVSELKTAMNGKDAKYKLQFTSHNTENKAAGTVYVYGISGTNRTDWSDSTLTHNLALTNGLHEDKSNLLGEVYVSGKNVTFTVDVTDYILSIPEDGIATLKIQNNVENAPVIVFQSSESAVSDAAKPKLIAERAYTDDYTCGINPKIYLNGKIATELAEGVATARVAFINDNLTDAAKGTLIIALYNGEKLENIKSVSIDFSDEFVNDMSVSIDVPEGEGYSVKAILVSGADVLMPLSENTELR